MLSPELQKKMMPSNSRHHYRLYHESGRWQTCTKFEAVCLLRVGKWHDKTKYSINEEVLPNENEIQERRQQSRLQCQSESINSKKTRKRKKPKHELSDTNTLYD